MKSKEITIKCPNASPLMDALISAGIHSDEDVKTVVSYRKIANRMLREKFTIRSKRDLQVCINALHFSIVFHDQFKSKVSFRRISKYKRVLESLILAKHVVF